MTEYLNARFFKLKNLSSSNLMCNAEPRIEVCIQICDKNINNLGKISRDILSVSEIFDAEKNTFIGNDENGILSYMDGFWFEDYIYKSLLPNNSAPVTDTYFWEKVGRGFLLAQEPSTGGSISFIRNHDFVTGTDYNGYAPEGSLISDAVWTITKLTINPNGSVVKTIATNIKWIDRYTTTYV